MTAQLEYTYGELLAGHKITEPLMAGGVRCHGGFDEDGRYTSPRTLNRAPAIVAWQGQHRQQFGTPLVEPAPGTFTGHYPNVAQSKFLLEKGVREPLIMVLTRIGTVEGFGAMIRYSDIPDFQRCFDEEVTGTATAHLDRGLYEAHARDEAGYEEEGGHKQMWFAARDIAFENPLSEADAEGLLARMGLGAGPGGGGSGQAYQPLFADVDPRLEILIARMANLLLIEISAAHTFAWAEELLADPDRVAGDGEAAKLVSYIRQDERPHVEYLKTTLSEMRDRTIIGLSGRKIPGAKAVGGLWDRALGNFTGARREQGRATTLAEIEHALEVRPDKGEILEQFHALGDELPTGPAAPADPSSSSY